MANLINYIPPSNQTGKKGNNGMYQGTESREQRGCVRREITGNTGLLTETDPARNARRDREPYRVHRPVSTALTVESGATLVHPASSILHHMHSFDSSLAVKHSTDFTEVKSVIYRSVPGTDIIDPQLLTTYPHPLYHPCERYCSLLAACNGNRCHSNVYTCNR